MILNNESIMLYNNEIIIKIFYIAPRKYYANSKTLTSGHSHRQNADRHLEAYEEHFLLIINRGDNQMQPSTQKYCYGFLEGAEQRLTESNVGEFM